VRGALVEGLRELRREPWLLDYAFASLREDELTKGSYGQREIDRAKEWFQRTEIKVVMATSLYAGPVLPCVSIGLMESVEIANTLGDVHHDTSEPDDTQWPALAGPFDPDSYDPATGAVVLPASVTLVVVPGMVLVDREGRQHEVLEVDGQTVTIAAGTVADLRGSTIRGARPSRQAALESAQFRETYQIGCFVGGEVVHLTYLHSLVVFVLMRRRQDLLEARGFQASQVSSAPAQRLDLMESDVAYARYLNLTGTAMSVWPKAVAGRLYSVGTQVGVARPGVPGEPFVSADSTPEDEAWLASDALVAKNII
jgi:hypothetical protein